MSLVVKDGLIVCIDTKGIYLESLKSDS